MPRFQANFQLYAENINRAVAFYTENFPFKLLGHAENGDKEAWAALRIENAILWLGKRGARSGLILIVDSEIEQLIAQLKTANVEFFVPESLQAKTQENEILLTTEWGKHSWFLDSEQNTIMLFQPVEL